MTSLDYDLDNYQNDYDSYSEEVDADNYINKETKLHTYSLADVDPADYPDFCDAYINSASIMVCGQIIDLSHYQIELLLEYQPNLAQELALENN